jgi:hypothetical protein
MSERATKKLQQEWDIAIIRVDGKNTGELENTKVPCNRMGELDLQIFLKALLAKHSGEDAKSLLEHFVNGRQGSPQRSSRWKIKKFFDEQKKSHGYYCGEKPLFAVASLPLSDVEVAFFKKVQAENRNTV